MPFDRRITVNLRAEGTRDPDTGAYIPGPETPVPMWAEERDGGSTDEIGDLGFITITSLRMFVVRYRADIANQPVFRLSVTDAQGNRWDGENIILSDMRRRTIEIQTRRVV